MEKHFVQRYQDGEITLEEFQRLNAIQIIESEGHRIFGPEAREYLKGLLVAAAPPAPFDQKVKEMMDGIESQREEIAKAFLAIHECDPADVEQYSGPDPEHGMGIVWGLRLKKKPISDEIIEALQASERALMTRNVCMDPECGSDPCDAYQKILAVLPADKRVNVNCATISHVGKKQIQAKRPTIGIDRAGMILDEIDNRIGKIPGEATEPLIRIRTLLSEFRERWFNFHEQTLQAIEDALPDSVEELGGTLPAAVATITKRLDLAEREADKLRDEMQAKQEEADERWGGYATGASATYGHVGDVSQIISDLDLYQERLEKLAKEWTGRVHQHLTQELLLYADLLRSACANLEPLRTASADGSSQRGDANLISKINEIVQEWISRGRAWSSAERALDGIKSLIDGFGMAILAQARAQEKEEEQAGPAGKGNSPQPIERSPGSPSEDPRILIRDILIRIIYIGHPAEAKTEDGKPDWRRIIARINAYLHPEDAARDVEIENLRALLDVMKSEWAPVLDFFQHNGDAMGMRAGRSIPERVLQIATEYLARPGEHQSPEACGLRSEEHLLTDCPNFQIKAEP